MGELITEVRGKLSIPYRWSYGESLTRFFEETKLNKRIMGARCTKCNKVLVPAQKICGRCFAPTQDEWEEVSDHGRLVSFTTVYLPFPGQPTDPPYTYGMILLDGASTQLPHLIREIEPEAIECDMRVQAVWSEERKGDLYDIRYFKPEE